MGTKIFKNIWNVLRACGLVFTILFAVAYVVSAYGGMVDPAEGTKYALLGLGYPLLLVASLLLLIAWLLLRQWKIAAVIIVSFVVTIDPILTYCPLNVGSHDLTSQERKNSFTLLTFNVMNFDDFDGSVHERNRTVQYILDTDADMVCLQEGAQQERFTDIAVIKNELPELLERYPYHTDGIDDMVFLSKYPFEEGSESITNIRKKVVSYDVHVGDKTIRIYNCHLHSIGLTMDDKEIYRQMTEIDKLSGVEPVGFVKELRSNVLSKLSQAFVVRSGQARELRKLIDGSGENVIVCGDFNDTPGSYCYRTVRGNDLHDAYLDCAFGPTITYHDNRFYFKIDNIFYRGKMKAVDIERGSIDSSDHYPLLATFVWQ